MVDLNPVPALPAEDLEQVLDETSSLWPELRRARIFISGATGFFGRWMLESLRAADQRFDLGVSVVALSRDPEKFLKRSPHLRHPAVRWLHGSVATLTPDAVAGEKFDAVIHLATEADARATLADPAGATDVIAGGTRRVLDVAVQTGARHFLFTSSGSVCGPQPPELALMPEDFSGAPTNAESFGAYAVSGEAKRQAEQYCAAYVRERSLSVVIARCFTFAGPGLPLDGKFAFGNFLQDVLAGRTIVIKGDGSPIRSYLYAADLTSWLWTLLLRGKAGEIYNVGSENAISLGDLAKTMARELDAPGVSVLQPPGTAAVHRYVPSTRRVREQLGLRENIDLTESIRRSAAWNRVALHH